jgi:lactoylglutathione lyase
MKKIKLLALFLLLTNLLQAQKNNSFDLTFNHLALSVKDVNIAADFYKDVLNLKEITNRTKMEGIRWFSLGDNKELHLVSTIKENVTINKAVHLALTTSNFDDFIITLDKFNIMYSDWPGTAHKINIRADGIKQVYFQDPDGYWIEVNSVAQK